MRKKLIAAIIVVLILLAAAVGVIVYMEKAPAEAGEETTAPATTVPATSGDETTEAPVETTEETVGLSLPTEDPDDVTPEATFGEEDIMPSVPVETGTGETEGPDANESPEDVF